MSTHRLIHNAHEGCIDSMRALLRIANRHQHAALPRWVMRVAYWYKAHEDSMSVRWKDLNVVESDAYSRLPHEARLQDPYRTLRVQLVSLRISRKVEARELCPIPRTLPTYHILHSEQLP